jgi:hypothetical protein
MKINKYYQYIVVAIGISCLIVGFFEKNGLLLALGGILLVGAVGTVIHLTTGKHNSSSKLPKDYDVGS